MTYIRKFTALILSLIFCAALIIGTGVILAVRNVNVEFIKYSADGSDEYVMAEYAESKAGLEKLKGANLLFIGEDDINDCMGNGEYLFLASYKKVFPCTVNVVLKERIETFACAVDGGYSVYDDTGRMLRKSKTFLNSLDDSPNVIVEGDPATVPVAAEFCSYFKKYFTTLRNYVESVCVEESLIGRTSLFTFNLRSGLKIIIADYSALAEEKVRAAFVEYCSLTESEKLSGSIMVIDKDGTSSSVQAYYMR